MKASQSDTCYPTRFYEMEASGLLERLCCSIVCTTKHRFSHCNPVYEEALLRIASKLAKTPKLGFEGRNSCSLDTYLIGIFRRDVISLARCKRKNFISARTESLEDYELLKWSFGEGPSMCVDQAEILSWLHKIGDDVLTVYVHVFLDRVYYDCSTTDRSIKQVLMLQHEIEVSISEVREMKARLASFVDGNA